MQSSQTDRRHARGKPREDRAARASGLWLLASTLARTHPRHRLLPVDAMSVAGPVTGKPVKTTRFRGLFRVLREPAPLPSARDADSVSDKSAGAPAAAGL